MDGDEFSYLEFTDEVGWDSILLLKSAARGYSPAPCVDQLGVFPRTDGSTEFNDRLWDWCAVAQHGTRRLKETVCMETHAADCLCPDDEGDSSGSCALNQACDCRTGSWVLSDGAEFIEEDQGSSSVAVDRDFSDHREYPGGDVCSSLGRIGSRNADPCSIGIVH